MGDLKSKIPDFHEVASFTGKLFKDIKKSIGEIMVDYKKNRAAEAAKAEASAKTKEGKDEKEVKSARVEVKTTTVETTVVNEDNEEPAKKATTKEEETK